MKNHIAQVNMQHSGLKNRISPKQDLNFDTFQSLEATRNGKIGLNATSIAVRVAKSVEFDIAALHILNMAVQNALDQGKRCEIVVKLSLVPSIANFPNGGNGIRVR